MTAEVSQRQIDGVVSCERHGVSETALDQLILSVKFRGLVGLEVQAGGVLLER